MLYILNTIHRLLIPVRNMVSVQDSFLILL